MSKSSQDVSIVSQVDEERAADKRKHSGWFPIIREFSLNTTAHGLPGIARSNSLHNRIYWSIALLAFTGFMIYLIVQAVRAYLEYPTQMDLSVAPEWPQYFPAFSFCNAGGMRSDLFLGALLNYTNALNLTNSNDTSILLPNQILSVANFVRDTVNANKSMEPYFYSLSSLLYSCQFNSVPCNETDFIPFMTATFGMCYTFNAKLKDATYESVRDGNQYGGAGKLELGLYVHSHLYLPYLVDSKCEEKYFKDLSGIFYGY